MKFLKYLFLLVIPLLSLSSCVDEVIKDNTNDKLQQGDKLYYIKLDLKVQSSTFSDPNTRIGLGLENGTHNEHAINPKAGNFALFFDSQDKYITFADLYSVNETGVNEEETFWDPAAESIYSCRFYGFADNKPSKVLIVVNAPAKISDKLANFAGWNLDEVRKSIWEEEGKLDIEKYKDYGIAEYASDPYGNLGFFEDSDETKYFTMTNAVYLEYKNGSYKLHDAEPIPDEDENKGKYITTDEKEIGNLTPIKVYLERMVSKVNLSLAFEPEEYHPISAQPLDVYHYENGDFYYTEAPWALEILGWGMNGLETQNYLFKNISIYRDADNGSTGSRLADWITHDGWNSEYNKRCFWSEDPHYIKDTSKQVIYPWQFDFANDIYDSDHTDWYEYFQSYDNQIENQKFALTYYPFSKFCSFVGQDGKLEAGYKYDGDRKIEYIPENTFVPGMQVDRSRGTRSYELAASHLILCARLLLQNQVGDQIRYSPTSNIYRNRVGVTYVDELSMLEDFMNAINYKLSSQKYMYYKYYPWVENKIANVKKNNPDSYYGHTVRALSEGEYALYCYFPDENKTKELTYAVLEELVGNASYRLWKDADAINADGKIIPWIMYKPNGAHDYQQLNLMVMLKNGDAEDASKSFTYIDPKYNGEVINGNPENNGYIPGFNQTYAQYFDSRKLKFEKADNDKWNGNYERDDNDIQSLFYEIWGVADCFTNGLMYYAVPIYAQENSGLPASTDEKQLDVPNSEFNDDSFFYYYGVIRNNWYKINIHSIKDIGIPVSNPFKPIVPNYSGKKNQLKVEMKIIPMHVEEIVVPI